MDIGFSTKKYLKEQKKAIEERVSKFDRLYLEFGGKLLDDFHASRVLPGYDPNAKLDLLKSLKKDLEMIFCVSAKQLSGGKINGNWGVGYDLATTRSLSILKENGLNVSAVVINRFEGEIEAVRFKKKMERSGYKVYLRGEIDAYPNNIDNILSKKGFGKDEHIESDKKLIVVWGAGPGSGKLSTCLGQIYLDSKKGVESGYAKFETFPVWDLALNHPVNVAYEASTADLGDYNLVDIFHKKAYGKISINYNRDVGSFPIIKKIFSKMLPSGNFGRKYKSPTDMGVNHISSGIINDRVCRLGAKKDIVMYWYRYNQEYGEGLVDGDVFLRMKKIMKKVEVDKDYLVSTEEARRARKELIKNGGGEGGVSCGASIELMDGRIVYGKNSKLLYAESAVVLNAIKTMAKIPDGYKLVSKSVIAQIGMLKKRIGSQSTSLEVNETLLALAVSARDNPLANKAIKYLKDLSGCYIHTTHKPSVADEKLFRKLGMWLTTDGIVEKVSKNPVK